MKVKSSSYIQKLQSVPALNRRITTSKGSAALQLYILEQQEQRLKTEAESLKVRDVANERRLKDISKEKKRLILKDPLLTESFKEVKEKEGVKKNEERKHRYIKTEDSKGEKEWKTMELVY